MSTLRGEDAPGWRQKQATYYSPTVESVRSFGGSHSQVLARSSQQSSGALLDSPAALSAEDRRQNLPKNQILRSANPSSPGSADLDLNHTLSPELLSRLDVVAQKHASLKRQLSNRGRPARPKTHASSSAQELSLPPKERWEAMMAMTPEYASPMDVQNGLVQNEKQDLPVKPATPKRHVARRSISSPIMSPVPFSSPAPAHAVRRVNSIISKKQDEDVTTTASTQTDVGQPRISQDVEERQSVAGSTDSARTDDMSKLITTHGSAEAALRKVLEEKQASLARSEQLWQLVERQRAMILDLNKSMERALKEKDRYRSKLKEVLAKDGTSRSDMLGKLDRSGSIDLDQVPATPPQVRQRDDLQSSPQTPVRQARNMPAATSGRKRNDSLVDSPASLHQRTESMISDAGSVTLMEATPVKISPVTRATATTGARAHAPVMIQEPPRLKMEIPSSPPTVDNRPRSRKGPPTPLNLSAISKQVETPISEQTDAYSDSDYDQSPTTPNERGRRRTRADDESRQIADAKDVQDGSDKPQQSGKAVYEQKDASISSIAKDWSSPFGSASTGLPASPRPQLLASRPYTSRSDYSNISANKPTGQTLLAPLISPGLPSSPRPSDRPAGAPVPVPRPAKTPLPVRTPISDAFMIAGLPLSPAQPNQFLQLPSLGPLDLPSFSSTTTDHSPSASRSGSFADGTSHEQAIRKDSSSAVTDPAQAESQEPEPVAYPGLLLRPTAVSTIEFRVICPKSMTSRNDSPMESKNVQDFGDRFILEVVRRSDQERLWAVEKTLSGLPALHHLIKATCNFPAMLPQDSPFANEVRSNTAYRQAALAQYFKVLLGSSLPESALLVVCRYLSTNVIDSNSSPALGGSDHDSAVSLGPVQSARGRKSGILMRQEPGTAAWRSRLFVLEDHNLHCYHETGGDLLGTIALLGREIARSKPGNKPEHAFMITDGSRTGIVLRAKNDEERESWVETLVASTVATSASEPQDTRVLQIPAEQPRKLSSALPAPVATQGLQAVGYDSTVAAQAPTIGSPIQSPSASNITHESPMSAILGSQSTPGRADNNNDSSPMTAKSHKRGHSKKRSIFGFRTNKSSDDSSKSSQRDARSLSRHRPTASKAVNSKVVFGAPLAEAAKYFPPRDVDVLLPAPVYRCIEYLESVDAADEEGLFRRTGSNPVIDALKDRFNNEGDVKLIDGEPLDVHAVSGLLKRYLLKLPESVLTESLRADFHNAIALDDRQARLTTIAALIQRLPEANRELLATLTRFLIGVVNNSDRNKMNIKNVAIIFSPTLGNVPPELISLLLTEYSILFNDNTYVNAYTTSTMTSTATSSATGTPVEQQPPVTSRPGTPSHGHTPRPSGQVWNVNVDVGLTGPSANAFGIGQGYREVPIESLRSRKGRAA